MIYAYEKRSLKLIRMKFDKNHQMPKPSSEIRASVSARDFLSARDPLLYTRKSKFCDNLFALEKF